MRSVAKPDALPVTFSEGRPLSDLPTALPTFDDDPLFKQVSDPACSPEVLDAAWRFSISMPTDRLTYGLSLRRAIQRNPNLPEATLHELLCGGSPGAWINPAVDTHLLSHPMLPDHVLEYGLIRAAFCEFGGFDFGDGDVWIRLRNLLSADSVNANEFMVRWRSTLYAIVARER